MEIVGWIGSICFAICGLPAAYEAIRDKACSYSWTFLALWGIGEVFTSIYVIYLGNLALLFNYGMNFICLVILIYYNKRRVWK